MFIRYFNLIPRNIAQKLLELSIEFIYNIIKIQINYFGYIYFVLFFCIFFLILFLNLLSILPFGIALTSHIILILFLSLGLCFGIFFLGDFKFDY
jgi:F0F1-type ATP synthase membrane subunit a